MDTAIIIGASTGIGRATALKLADSYNNIAITSFRHRDELMSLKKELDAKGCHCLAMSGDAGDMDFMENFIRTITDTFGDDIDLLVNNAGFGISGAIEFTAPEDAKKLFDVNFFGMVNMNRAVVPLMRAAGHGRIVNLSSVAAPVPIPFQAYYSATKAAVNAYTMALANELRPFGVTVCAVMPGDIHTGFTAARKKVAEGDAIYHGRISRSVQRMEHDEETGMDPAKAGAYIAAVALRDGNRHPLYAIRFDYKFFTFLAKVLPARFLNWLIYCLYGK